MTTAPVIDERVHRDVIKALLTGPLNGHVYDYGAVPGADGNSGTLPNIYALLTVERRFVAPRRAGLAGRSGWRITVRYVGRTVDEARWAAQRAAQALDERRLDIGGIRSTPVTHESTTAIELDDGRFSGLAIYTYAL